MAFEGLRINVVGAPTPLVGSDASDYRPGKSIVVRNRSGVSLDVGGPGVAVGAGFELLANETVTVTLDQGEVPYAIGPAAGPYRVDVLRQGV